MTPGHRYATFVFLFFFLSSPTFQNKVKKVPPATDDGDTPRQPPAYGPTRKSLSRSRVLASRKRQRYRSKTVGLDYSIDSSPRSSPERQAPAAPVSTPTPILEPRAAGAPVLARPVRTVGDLVTSEKKIKQGRKSAQQQPPQQQQSPTKERKPKSSKKQQQESVAKVASPTKARDSDAGPGAPPMSA